MINSSSDLVRQRFSETTHYGVTLRQLRIITMWFTWQSSTVSAWLIDYNVLTDHTHQINRRTQKTELFAGKKGSTSNTKSNARTSNTKGGFGRVAVPRNDGTLDGSVHVDVDDDYRIFPALETRIRDTLIPVTKANVDDMSTIHLDAPLSSEIYQRLDQIYGFPRFNGHKSDNAMASSVSENSENDASLPTQTSPLDFLTMNTESTDSDPSDVPYSLSLEALPPFRKVRVLHVDPMILSVDDFFTPDECDQYIRQSETKSMGSNHNNNNNKNIRNGGGSVMQSQSPTVGKDAAAKAQRTSTTFYHKYETVPELMSKATRLLGITTIHQWEEPQTVRYRKNEKFTWHLDALGPIEQQSSSSGQRTATLLVYLTDLNRTHGGATLFRDLGGDSTATDNGKTYLRVQPKKGTALLFFPSAGGIPDCPFDIRTLHCGEVVSSDASNDKWIAQLWLRQRSYTPTAPPGNRHRDAYAAIANYCQQYIQDEI